MQSTPSISALIAPQISTFLSILLIFSQSISDAKPDQRIVNGKLAQEKQFPHQVALFETTPLHYVCGGSIINENFVLTAAHCVEKGEPENYSIVYGTINYRNGSKAYVQQIIIHENYRYIDDNKKLTNDIALLKLAHPLTFDEYTKAIPLQSNKVPVGTTVTISGFGVPSVGELRYLETNVIKCDNDKFVGIICLKKDAVHGSCRGDSGGPAIYKNKLIGITSFGIADCNETHASYKLDGYSSVSFFYDWILESISLNKTE